MLEYPKYCHMKKSKSIDVSLNVLNYNTYEKTKKCIESCLKQECDNLQVLLIDNKSTDGSFEKLKEEFRDKIEYLQTGFNYGYAKGNNIGIRYCYEQGIAFSFILNSDTELVGDGLVCNMLKVMNSYQDCAVVAPLIYDVTKKGLVLNENDSAYHKALRLFRVIPQNEVLSDNLYKICEAQGSALLVDNSVFLKLGGFPEHYFMYCEECTFAKKVLWSGKRIYWYRSKEEYILHHHDRTIGIEPWRAFLKGRNMGLEYYENRKDRLAWRLIYSAFILRLKFSKDKSMIDGFREAKQIYRSRLSKEETYNKAVCVKNEYVG